MLAESTVAQVRARHKETEGAPIFIKQGSPWENGRNESFNRTLREELLNREAFTSVWEPKMLVEEWLWEYNPVRPHSSLGYRQAALEVVHPAPLHASS